MLPPGQFQAITQTNDDLSSIALFWWSLSEEHRRMKI